MEVDLGITDHDVWVATKLGLLGLKISKCSADREPTWEDSERANERVVHCVLVTRWLLDSDLLQAWLALCIDYRVCLINVSTSSFYSSELPNFARLVVVTKVNSDSSAVPGANSSTISDVDCINIVVICHDKVGATSRLAILHLLCCLEFSIAFVDVVHICYLASFIDCRINICWEFRLHNDIVMEVLFQVFCTLVASVAIVDSEYLNLGPFIFGDFGLLAQGLDHIKNDCDPVLICFSDKANMGVCCE